MSHPWMEMPKWLPPIWATAQGGSKSIHELDPPPSAPNTESYLARRPEGPMSDERDPNLTIRLDLEAYKIEIEAAEERARQAKNDQEQEERIMAIVFALRDRAAKGVLTVLLAALLGLAGAFAYVDSQIDRIDALERFHHVHE